MARRIMQQWCSKCKEYAEIKEEFKEEKFNEIEVHEIHEVTCTSCGYVTKKDASNMDKRPVVKLEDYNAGNSL